MKLSELKTVSEWKIGTLSPLSLDDYAVFLSSSLALPYTIHYGDTDSTQHIKLWKHDLGTDNFALIFTNARDKSNAVIGGAVLTPIKALHTKNIYCFNEISIPKDMQGKGFATNLYATLVVNMDIRLINSEQLSINSEKLWLKLGNYSQNSFYKAIWDKKLDKEYSLTDIGKKTEDGVEILHPHEDNKDPSSHLQRFFFMLISKNEAKTTEDLEKHNKNLTEAFNEKQRFGESYFSITYFLSGDE